MAGCSVLCTGEEKLELYTHSSMYNDTRSRVGLGYNINVLNGELIASFKIPLAAALKNLIHILP